MTQQSTPTEEPKTTPLTEVFSKILVTAGQAVALLHSLAEGQSDRDPTLVAAINQAITDIIQPDAKKAETEPTTTDRLRPHQTEPEDEHTPKPKTEHEDEHTTSHRTTTSR